MNVRRNILLLLFFVLMQGILLAQNPDFTGQKKDTLSREQSRWFLSLKAGSNFYAFPSHTSDEIKQIPKIALGARIKYKLSKGLSPPSLYFTTGINYENIKHKNIDNEVHSYSGFPQQFVKYHSEEIYSYSFINIPILFEITFLRKRTFPFIYTGVQFANMLGSSQSFHRTLEDEVFPNNNYDTSGVIKNYYFMKAFNPFLTGGAGILYKLSPRFSLSLDIRWIGAALRPMIYDPPGWLGADDASLDYMGVNIGLQFNFKKTKKK